MDVMGPTSAPPPDHRTVLAGLALLFVVGESAPARAARRPRPLARPGADRQSQGMRILVLLGTHHVGRAIVESALARGDDVTTLTRGESGPPVFGA